MITLYNIRPKGFNIGNDAIFMGLQHFLYQTFGEMVNIISLPATSRYESQAKAGFTSKTVHEINHFGDGVIVGGGNIYENGEMDVNLDALKALDVPMMIFSVSRGRIYNRYGQLVDRTDVMPDRVIKALNEKACISLARDQATFDHLRSLGCDKVELGGCPTVFLDQMQYRLPPVNPEIKDTAFISIRNPSLMNIPLFRQAQARNEIVEIIALLRQKGYSDTKLLCHDLRDIEFAASILGIDFVYTGDVYVYLNILRSCALNVSYRLHSALPCLAYGTPMVKISYDERASSLMKTLGYGDWNINLMEEANVLQAVEQRLNQLSSLTELKAKTKPQFDATYSTMSHAFQRFSQAMLKKHS